MSRSFLFFLLISLSFSCNKSGKDVIKEDKFTEIIIDLHVADAIATDYTQNRLIGDPDSATIYNSVFNKYQISREQFDRSMQHYANEPAILARIYDNAFTEISKKLEDLRKEVDRLDGDNHQVWQDRTYYRMAGDTNPYPGPFIVEIDGAGEYIIKTKMRLTPQDESENPYFSAYFYKEKDIPEERIAFDTFPLIKTNHSRDFIFVKELQDSTYKHLKFSLINFSNSDSSFKKHFNTTSLQVYRIEEED